MNEAPELDENFEVPDPNEEVLAILYLAAEAVDARRGQNDYALPVDMATLCHFAVQRNLDVIQHALSKIDFEEGTVEDFMMALSTTAITALVDGFAIASQISELGSAAEFLSSLDSGGEDSEDS